MRRCGISRVPPPDLRYAAYALRNRRMYGVLLFEHWCCAVAFFFLGIQAPVVFFVVSRYKYRRDAALNISGYFVTGALAFVVNAFDALRFPHTENGRHVRGLQVTCGFKHAARMRKQHVVLANFKTTRHGANAAADTKLPRFRLEGFDGWIKLLANP